MVTRAEPARSPCASIWEAEKENKTLGQPAKPQAHPWSRISSNMSLSYKDLPYSTVSRDQMFKNTSVWGHFTSKPREHSDTLGSGPCCSIGLIYYRFDFEATGVLEDTSYAKFGRFNAISL